MLEIPAKLFDLFKRLLFDYEYFEYAFCNGGFILFTIMIFGIIVAWNAMKKRKGVRE